MQGGLKMTDVIIICTHISVYFNADVIIVCIFHVYFKCVVKF